MHRPFIVALLVLIASAITIHAQHSGSAPSSSWTAPRTAWGDPDLQGNYTNKYETSTPAIFEYACHEGNQAIKNILSAARSAEAAGTR